MAQARTEFELKLCGTAADVASAPRLASLDRFAASPGDWERLVSTYYDSADRRLAAAGLSLRIRDEAEGRTLTVKSAPSGATPIRRMEYERSLSAGESGFVTGDSEIDAFIGEGADLGPIARTTTDRWRRFLEHQGALIEISAETGRAERLLAPAGAAPLAEIELELLKGDPAALFAVAEKLNAEFSGRLRVSVETKLSLALRASGLQRAKPEKSGALPADATAGDVLAASLRRCAIDIVEAATIVLECNDGEAARRLRVALRRLRAAEKAFRPLFEDRPLKKLAAEARALARVVGAARDLDLFIERSLTLASDGPLRARLEGERARLWNAAARALSSAAFGAFSIDLVRATWLEEWRRAGRRSLEEPARDFADKMLERRYARLAESVASADFAVPATLHAPRIELKKFRYAAQFFRDFYAGAARKEWFAAMSGLQDALGAVNDSVSAVRIADGAAVGGGASAARAAGFIAGFRSAEAREQAAAAKHAWAALAAAPACWRARIDPVTEES